MTNRTERDSLGEVAVPSEALYGAQTARAISNFPISGVPLDRRMIRALGLLKQAAARVNEELGLLDSSLAKVIAQAAEEVSRGEHDHHFPVDVFQTGSGTSSNMNANEVISNRAIQLLGGELGSKHPVHPNDHVNLGQSSNDVFPSAIHIATTCAVSGELLPALMHLETTLEAKARDFHAIVKTGRTHLQDATPIRLGQEFTGYVGQLKSGREHIAACLPKLRHLAVGGTAVGTGLNTHPEFGARVASEVSKSSGESFSETRNHFAAQAGQEAALQLSGALKSLATSLIKIANDIRWLASGPKLGLGELELPAVQPGSSIMPGKVNPVIAEAAIMASVQVIANDTAIAFGNAYGNFELNTMLPLIASNLLEQVTLLTNVGRAFADKLVAGLTADEEHIAAMNEHSPALVTALVPHLGYDRAAKLATRALKEGKTIRELASEEGVMPEDELDRALDLAGQTGPR